MSELTPELALITAEDEDDTADYLTQTAGLRGSLNILDGLFNATTGHNHNGAHQGGTLIFNQLRTTSILFANGATLGPTGTGNQLRFQSTQVQFSGAASVEGALTVAGATTLTGGISGNTVVTGNLNATGALTVAAATVNGALVANSLQVNGNGTITGTLNVSGALSAPSISSSGQGSASEYTATAGWFRNGAAGTGLYNNAVGIGLRFDTGGTTPVIHGGVKDGQRLHGSAHVRSGFFQSPVVANNAEVQVQVNFNPPFPAGASPTVVLTVLRGAADHLEWRIGLEFGQIGPAAFNSRLKNETGTSQQTYVQWLAYWNE